MSPRESHDWLGLLESSMHAFADVAEHGDQDAAVRHCPGWTLCHLAQHLGGVHQWAAHAVEAGDPHLTPTTTDVGGPALAQWDAEHALGRPTPYDPGLAWDGVLEVVDVMYPRQVRLGRIDQLPTPVDLVADDVVVDGVPARTRLGGRAGSAVDPVAVEVRALAEVLLRLLWHRASDEELASLGTYGRSLASVAVTP